MLSYIVQLPVELVGAHVFSALSLTDLVRLDSAAAQRCNRHDFEAVLKCTVVKIDHTQDRLEAWRWCVKRYVIIEEFTFGGDVEDIALLSGVVRQLGQDAVVIWNCGDDQSTASNTYVAIEGSGILEKVTRFHFNGSVANPHVEELCSKMTSLQEMHVTGSPCMEPLLSCPPLRALLFEFMSIKGVDLGRLLLGHVPTLRTLSLLHVHVDSNALRAISQLTNLTTLFLLPTHAGPDDANLDAFTLESLLTAIAQGCTKLECVAISLLGRHWPAHALEGALPAFACRCTQLREISFSPAVGLGDKTLIRLAENCPALHKLKGVCWEVTSMDTVTAAQSLLARLTVLEVRSSFNAVVRQRSAVMAATLGCAISKLECMAELNVSGLAIRTELLRDAAVSVSLPASWDLEQEALMDHCLSRMAAQCGARLRHFAIVPCHTTNPSVLGGKVALSDATIATLARHCCNLEWVDLSACAGVTEAAVLGWLESCPRLWFVEVPSDFSPEASQRVVEGIRRNCAGSARPKRR